MINWDFENYERNNESHFHVTSFLNKFTIVWNLLGRQIEVSVKIDWRNINMAYNLHSYARKGQTSNGPLQGVNEKVIWGMLLIYISKWLQYSSSLGK